MISTVVHVRIMRLAELCWAFLWVCRSGVPCVLLLAPVNKVIDKDGPCAFRIVVCHVIVDVECEVQEEVPGVFWDGSLVIFLRE